MYNALKTVCAPSFCQSHKIDKVKLAEFAREWFVPFPYTLADCPTLACMYNRIVRCAKRDVCSGIDGIPYACWGASPNRSAKNTP